MAGLAVAACSPAISPSDLRGSYLANYVFGSETIEIREDGSFTQRFDFRSSPLERPNVGRWRFDPDEGVVMFEGFRTTTDGYCERRIPSVLGPAVLPAERSYLLVGRMRLGPDEGCPYIKQ